MTTTTATVIARTPRPIWIKPMIGTVLLLIIMLTGPAIGWLTAGDKINAAIDRNAARVDVTVNLPFEPEPYHRNTLSSLGVYSGRGRDGGAQLRLRAVEQANLDRIARYFWVESIEPF